MLLTWSLFIVVVSEQKNGAVSVPSPLTFGRRKALCIGVNDYSEFEFSNATSRATSMNTLSSLHGCVNDASSLGRILSSKHGFSEVRVLLNSRATRSSIFEHLLQLGFSCTSGDLLLVYFSGHGTRRVLMAHDACVDVLEITATCHSFSSVHSVLLLDSCSEEIDPVMVSADRDRPDRECEHAGTSLATLRKRGPGSALLSNRYERHDKIRQSEVVLAPATCSSDVSNGVFHTVTTASSPMTAAYEKNFGDECHGLFTYFLMQELLQDGHCAPTVPLQFVSESAVLTLVVLRQPFPLHPLNNELRSAI